MTEQPFTLTDDHLKLLREMVFIWMDAGENGVPFFYGYSTNCHEADDLPYQPQDRHTDMARILNVDPSDQAGLDQTHQQMGQALETFLEQATLAPGDYTFPNKFKQFPPSLRAFIMPALFNSWERYGEWRKMPAPTEDTITFHLTDEHLKLLRALRVRWRDGYEGIWEKRPYGDMTYFELDMAEILGIAHDDEFTEDQLSYFHQLHTDMLNALPVFLKHGMHSSSK